MHPAGFSIFGCLAHAQLNIKERVCPPTGSAFHSTDNLGLLVDPVELGSLVGDKVTLGEPESNLLLGVLDGVGAVADVAADIDGEVTTDGARGGGKGVGGTEDG